MNNGRVLQAFLERGERTGIARTYIFFVKKGECCNAEDVIIRKNYEYAGNSEKNKNNAIWNI